MSCSKENAEAYTYLLRNVMKSEPMIEALNNASYTCFSVGHKGSALALPALCPLTEGYDVHNLFANNLSTVGAYEYPKWLWSTFVQRVCQKRFVTTQIS